MALRPAQSHGAYPRHAEGPHEPRRPPAQLWNTDDLDDPDALGPLGENHGWYGNEHRIECVNRIKFWRFIVGDQAFDMHRWLTRVENMPETLAPTVA